jgi:fumarate reductase flavoprotein subunit
MSKKEMTADVVVIGGGAAGMPAALQAKERGITSVILLDKMPVPGGNARMAGGYLFAADAYTHKEAGVERHGEDVYRQQMQFHHCDGINPRQLQAFIGRTADNLDWLRKKGIEYEYNPMMGNSIVGAGAPGSYAKVLDVLRKEFLELGGTILTKTTAKKLELDENGAVCGVFGTDSDGNDLLIHTKNVILCVGGFMGNKELMERYFADQYDESAYVTDALKYNGDGVLMAQQAGALLSSKATLVKESGYSFSHIKNRPNRISMIRGAMWVNADGERFCDESTAADHTNANLLVMQPGMYGYAVFDEERIEDLIAHPTPQVNNAFLEPGDPLVREQLEEAAEKNPDLCKIADSLEELADWMHVDRQTFADTVSEYNHFCETGNDEAFLKGKEHLFALKKAPFYAVKFTPLMIDTIGPLVVNHHFQVLAAKDRKPIRGFYAAGNITSGWQGRDYELWGGNLSYGMSSGRIAADDIADTLE